MTDKRTRKGNVNKHKKKPGQLASVRAYRS